MQGEEEQQKLYPQLFTSGTITLKDLMKHASEHTSFNPAEVLGMVTYLEDTMKEYLA